MTGRWAVWWLAARPKTLSAAAVPVAVGTAVAYAAGGHRWGPAIACLLGALFIQIGTNFANDVFDFEQGADTADRVGPARAVATGLVSPAAMRRAMVAAFALATVCGLYLIPVGGWPIALIGVASIASGIAYTGGPFPLGYHGLGELFVLVFFGFVAVCGTAYVQLGQVPALAWWAAVPVGALATAILVVNNLRDRHTDRQAGKRTLAVRFGRRAAWWQFTALVGIAYAVPSILAIPGAFMMLLPWLSAPLAVVLLRDLARLEGPALNPVLARTGVLLLVFGMLLTAGIVAQ